LIVMSEPFISNLESLIVAPPEASPGSILPFQPAAEIPPPGTLRAGSAAMPPIR
jgi:hypothetical protein